MKKKRRKHELKERLKYMQMLEKGYSINYIHVHYGINSDLLKVLWLRYQSEGVKGLEKGRNVKADYDQKCHILDDIEKNQLTLAEAELKYNVSASALGVWLRTVRSQGRAGLASIKQRGRPPKSDMGRPKKKKPEEMTELEFLRYENECLKAENALLKKVKALVEERDRRLREIGREPSEN